MKFLIWEMIETTGGTNVGARDVDCSSILTLDLNTELAIHVG